MSVFQGEQVWLTQGTGGKAVDNWAGKDSLGGFLVSLWLSIGEQEFMANMKKQAKT